MFTIKGKRNTELSFIVDKHCRRDFVKTLFLDKYRADIKGQIGFLSNRRLDFGPAVVVVESDNILEQIRAQISLLLNLEQRAVVVFVAFSRLLLQYPQHLPCCRFLSDTHAHRHRIDKRCHQFAHIFFGIIPARHYFSKNDIVRPTIGLKHHAPGQFDTIADGSTLGTAQSQEFVGNVFIKGADDNVVFALFIHRHFAQRGNFSPRFVISQQFPPVSQTFCLVLAENLSDCPLIFTVIRLLIRRAL